MLYFLIEKKTMRNKSANWSASQQIGLIIFQFFDDVQDRHYESAMIGRPFFVPVGQSVEQQKKDQSSDRSSIW